MENVNLLLLLLVYHFFESTCLYKHAPALANDVLLPAENTRTLALSRSLSRGLYHLKKCRWVCITLISLLTQASALPVHKGGEDRT